MKFTLCRRKNLTLAVLALVVLSVLLAAGKISAQTTNAVTEDARVAFAKKVLADYQAGAPRNHRVLHVAYFCPSDRSPAPDYQARLGRVLGEISQFYAEQLQHYGLPFTGIPLAKDGQGRLIIHLVQGAHPAADYSEANSAGEIHEDVRKVMEAEGVGLKTNDVVVFTRLGNYDGTNTSHNSPYCGMGDSHSGFCWQFDSDILDSRLLTNTNRWVQDRQYGHITFGKYNSIFIGGTAHELGHLFGLPHNAETPADLPVRGHALMGDGNRHLHEELRGDGKGTFITLADALRLVSNPLFSGVDKGLNQHWRYRVTHCAFDNSEAGHLKLTGQFQSSQPVYGVVAYVDPDGDSNYNAVSYAGNVGTDGTFSFAMNSLPKGSKPGEIRLILLCASGQHLKVGLACQARFRYTVGPDGRLLVDMGKTQE